MDAATWTVNYDRPTEGIRQGGDTVLDKMKEIAVYYPKSEDLLLVAEFYPDWDDNTAILAGKDPPAILAFARENKAKGGSDEV